MWALLLKTTRQIPLRGLIILWRGGACPGSEVNSDTLCSLRLLPDSANSFITVSALSRDTQAVAHRSRFPRHAAADCCSAGFMSRAGSWYKWFFYSDRCVLSASKTTYPRHRRCSPAFIIWRVFFPLVYFNSIYGECVVSLGNILGLGSWWEFTVF